MKIVHATSVHPAHDHRIAYKEAFSAAQAGYEVTIVAARGYDPSIPGVGVDMVGRAERNRLQRATATAYDVAVAATKPNPDIIQIHDPELLWLLPYLKKSAPVVFDIHEDIPAQMLDKHWVPSWARRPFSSIVRRCLWQLVPLASGIVYAGPFAVDRPTASPHAIVQNFPRLNEFQNQRPAIKDALCLAYIGGLSRDRGVVEMVDAVGMLPDSVKAELHLAGPLSDKLQQELMRNKGWVRTIHHPWLSRSEAADLLSKTHVGLVVLHPRPNYLESYPTKMFEYMAAGCAVIASDFPLWRTIVEDADCGVLTPPCDAESLAMAIMDLAADPDRMAKYGQAGRKAVEEKYNWNQEAAKLLSLYDQVLRSGS